jgi:protein-tyrosine-phosphatase
MWNQFGLAFFVVLAMGWSMSANSQTPRPNGARPHSTRVVFVCEHGAALSVVSAAYFNKIAKEERLNLHAVARGTEPQKEVSISARTGLNSDGIPFESRHPQSLSARDAAQARQIVTFCPLPARYSKLAPVEAWNDVPPTSADYGHARDAILSHLRELIARLKSEGTARP